MSDTLWCVPSPVQSWPFSCPLDHTHRGEFCHLAVHVWHTTLALHDDGWSWPHHFSHYAMPTVFLPTLSYAAFAAYISPTGDWWWLALRCTSNYVPFQGLFVHSCNNHCHNSLTGPLTYPGSLLLVTLFPYFHPFSYGTPLKIAGSVV
jgi:hypothetical protein